jgi:Ca2+-transporting ATPase
MGMSKNLIFISIILIVVGIQVIIIYFGDVAFSTTPLNGTQWLATVLIGFISLPWGMFIRLLPIETLFGVPDQTIHLSLPIEVAEIHPLHKSMSQNNDFSWFAAVRGSKGRAKNDVRTILP